MALSTVGPYRVLERLGAGANGEVFLAEDTRLQRRVALKTLSGTAGSDATELRRRLLREARAAARLNHSHIAAVYDVLESDEGVHIVMEYVKGSTLSAQVRQSPPAPMQVLDLALQLSDALAHAHGMGVIHRDLKPANIVVAPDGQAKILDFGLARLHAVDAGSTPLSSSELSIDARHTVGTPPYIPPEHLSGAPVDERGDVYSFGVTLFEALTGRRPFEATGGRGLADAILSAPTPRPRALCPEVPEGLDAIVFKAMARNPAERYASASEMLGDLRRLRDGITDAPTQSRRWPPPTRLKPRPIWTAGALAAVAVAIYGVLGVADRAAPVAAGSADSPAPNVVAVLPLAGAGGDAQTESLAAGVADVLITTLSRVPGLTVVSRAATMRYENRKDELDDMASELGATLLVDGRVQRSGEKLRITVSALRPGSPVAVWQGTYDGTFAEVFNLQREVAEAVASALRVGSAGASGLDDRPTRNVDAFADYAQARSFLERPDVRDHLDRSISLFRAAIEKDGRFARAYAGLGEAYWQKHRATKDPSYATQARDATMEALRLDPADAWVRYTLAQMLADTGRREDAIEELKTVVARQPGNDEAHRLLGTLLAQSGQSAEGVEHVEKAIALRPNYWRHHHGLGFIHYNGGRYPDALAAFRRVGELQPDNAWAFQMIGTTHHQMGDLAAAAQNYERAIALGSDASAHSNLGAVYYEQGRLEDAARAFETAIRLEPSAAKHRNLGDVRARQGRGDEAAQSYRRAAELAAAELRTNPRDATTMAMLAVYQAKLGEWPQAKATAAKAEELDPRNGAVAYRRAVVHALAGESDLALTTLERAIRHGASVSQARADEDFRSLRGFPGYQEFVAPPARKENR